MCDWDGSSSLVYPGLLLYQRLLQRCSTEGVLWRYCRPLKLHSIGTLLQLYDKNRVGKKDVVSVSL